jgi:hypothetical protein
VIQKDSEYSIVISNKDAHYLKSALPLLESTTEHKAVHLYAADGDIRFLSENLKSIHARIDAKFTGEGEAVIQMNRLEILQLNNGRDVVLRPSADACRSVCCRY